MGAAWDPGVDCGAGAVGGLAGATSAAWLVSKLAADSAEVAFAAEDGLTVDSRCAAAG